MNLRIIFIFMTLALGSESRNTLGTTGKGLLTTGLRVSPLTLPIINGKVCFVINLSHQFLSDTTVNQDNIIFIEC